MIKPQEVKLHTWSSTWGTRLSQLPRQAGEVFIVTYSLPDLPYVETQLGRLPHDIFLVCHEKFASRALALRQRFPGIAIKLHPKVHAKFLLIAPDTVYLGSANFGESHWHECTVGIRSAEAFDFYRQQFMWLYQHGQAVEDPSPREDAEEQRRQRAIATFAFRKYGWEVAEEMDWAILEEEFDDWLVWKADHPELYGHD